MGTCAQYGVDAPESGEAKAGKPNDETNVRKLMYHYGIKLGWLNNHDSYNGWAFTYHQMLSCLSQASQMGFDNWKNAFASDSGNSNPQAVISVVQGLWDQRASLDAAPSSFELYYCDAGTDQNFLIMRDSPTGKLKLRKASSNTGITG